MIFYKSTVNTKIKLGQVYGQRKKKSIEAWLEAKICNSAMTNLDRNNFLASIHILPFIRAKLS